MSPHFKRLAFASALAFLGGCCTAAKIPTAGAVQTSAPTSAPASAPATQPRSADGRAFASKPLVRSIYTADPSAHVFNGRIYIYPSHDTDKGPSLPDVEPFKGSQGNGFRMVDYCVLSMNRIGGQVTIHPPALKLQDVPWAARQLWAPDAAYKDGTYFLYFPAKDKAGAFRIGVATSKDPAGPFVARTEPIKGSYSIDPAVFTDDDGQSYMYFGGLSGGQLQMIHNGVYDPKAPLEASAKTDAGSGDGKTAMMPRVAKLTADMLEFADTPRDAVILDTDGKPMPSGAGDRRFFEACWMHKYNRKYYLSYSTGGTHFIAYAIGDSPLGPFTYRGHVLLPVQGWTTHHSILKFDSRWWLFYADTQMSNKTWLRNVKVTELFYNPDGTIRTIDPFIKP